MMNGIENITARILADAQAEADELIAQAQAQAKQTAAEAEARAKAQADAIVKNGQQAAEQRRQRLGSVAQLEARKLILEAKQQMVGRAFDGALARLCSLEGTEAVELLAKLAAAASVTGREEIILSARDREAIGPQVVRRANQLLTEASTPALPKLTREMGNTPVTGLLNRVVAGASAVLNSAGQLTLSPEARPMSGGLVLRAGPVETNCTFEALVQVRRSELAAPVAKLLFG